MKSLIQELVETHGVHSVEITVPMHPLRDAGFIQYTSSNDPTAEIPCRIVEDRYPVSDGYKVTLQSKVPGYGREHFYQSDLESLIERGHAQIRVSIIDEVAR